MKSPHDIIPLFKCDHCGFTSKSEKGVKIHKNAKHKIIKSPSIPLQPPINCVRLEDGCQNILYSTIRSIQPYVTRVPII